MLLKKLCEYSESLDYIPEMYLERPIAWIVDLDKEGKLQGFIRTQGSEKKNDRGKKMLAPHALRASAIVPKLLADNGEYALGISKKEKTSKRLAESHKAFKDLVDFCSKETDESSVQAVSRFLGELDLGKLDLPEDFTPDMDVTFRVEGVLPINLPSVQQFWAKYMSREPDEDEGAVLETDCIVCGKFRRAESRLQMKIKGLPGGQAAGTSLISANSQAFESYGLEASHICPICRQCAAAFTRGLNELIAGENTRMYLKDLLYVFWSKNPEGSNMMMMLDSPDPVKVKALLESPLRGKEGITQSDYDAFYAAALSASGGRAVIRDWIDSTISIVRKNIVRWFKMQKIVDPYGAEGAPCGIYALASSLYRDSRKEMVANVPKALLRTALTGEPMQEWILYQTIKRNKAEREIKRPRAVLIKMFFASQKNNKEDNMVSLDMSNQDPAYLCGRLLAEIEAIQKSAIRNIKATIVDRFYGTASTAPASVFGNLLEGAQPHLSKLRKESPATYEAFQKRLEEILSKLDRFPSTLKLKEQALFALGYYHQRAADRAAAIAYSEKKKAAKEAVEV